MKRSQMERVSISDFAEIAMIERASVYQMISNGRISEAAIDYHPVTGKRRLLLEQALEDVANNSDPDKIRRTKSGTNAHLILPDDQFGTKKSGKRNSEGLDEDPSVPFNYEDDPTDFHTAKEHEAIAKSKITKAKAQEVEGSLVNKAKMESELFMLGAAIRTDVVALEDMAPFLVALVLENSKKDDGDPELAVREHLRNAAEKLLTRHSTLVKNESD